MRLTTVSVPAHEKTEIEGMPEGHALFLHAALPDGRHLIVTRRQDARGFEERDHLVFLGQVEDMAQHEVRYVSTFSDGGSLEFDFAGGRARFKAKSRASDGKPNYASWFRGGASEAVEMTVLESADDRIYVG